MVEREVVVKLKTGLQARPAAFLFKQQTSFRPMCLLNMQAEKLMPKVSWES